MKGFTDLEQSKKLVKILPIESADAFYDMAEPEKRQVPIIGHPNEYYDMKDWAIPCWSLAALLDILPNGTETHKQVNESISCYFVEVYNNKKYFSTERHDDLLDACVEMIIKLKENDLL
jgi:hypothetical protein